MQSDEFTQKLLGKIQKFLAINWEYLRCWK